MGKNISIDLKLEVERTVRCSGTVWFLVMFGRFEVRFLAKITCSDMFEVRFWWFWKIFGPFFINKVREQFGFWWCSRGSKFGFGPKWDVRMCLKFDHLRFGMFQVRFFEVCSTSILYMANTCKYFSTADAYDPQKIVKQIIGSRHKKLVSIPAYDLTSDYTT